MTIERILIVGAIIAALTLAPWLRRNGLRPTVLERGPPTRRRLRAPGRPTTPEVVITKSLLIRGVGVAGSNLAYGLARCQVVPI
jgi:2-polyprenyl-6-methoxyphenol hydroxylase-like FAD-dependent oxidoreductase